MEAGQGDLPEPLEGLVARLEGRGFERRVDDHAEMFGNRVLELVQAGRELRLVRDRSQWSTQLCVAGEWWDSDLVLAALDGVEASTVAPSHAELAAITLEALDRLPEDEAAAELLRQTVEETAERRAPRLFGD